MADTRECPLCGGTMRVKQVQTVVPVPGNPQPSKRNVSEWVCPDCDYFEEIDDESA